MAWRWYWGDLHSHCSISYGHGTVDQALARARQQLDFCTITGHAFWPDMPTDRAVYAEIIDYHTEGFARLARNWEKLLARQATASEPGKFIAFPSYEWHSLKYGDHNVYARGPALQLRDAPDLPALRAQAQQQGAIVIPHHIGYAAGYRGIDWQHFRDEASPFVEIYSLHGCSESDGAPYPMLHDMGPRDAGSTAEAGWELGHRFGIIGSTDHHSAYPGSHGDGRLGVLASALTREAIWEALLARRVCAATGDRIDARLFVNGAGIGETVRAPGPRHLQVQVQGSDALDRVELLKNGRVLRRWWPESTISTTTADKHRLRVTWGWGRKDRPVHWDCRLSLSQGTITELETCFSGPPVVAPVMQEGDAEVADEVDLPHEILEQSAQTCSWRSLTVGNLSMRHGTTQAMSLELDAPLSATITVEANGQAFSHRLGDLLHAGRSHYLRGWLSEAIRIGPLVPLSACTLTAELVDEPERAVDLYRLRAAQHNGQWAWLTPIWAER
ncbi:MAG: Tat pathway signal sequence [Planctomycetia bacterium]|nr:Tat pathway signal sequence [Planctomycetia bacterium]